MLQNLPAHLTAEMTDFNIITKHDDLLDLAEHYQGKPAFAYDVETTGEDRLDALSNTVTWISFADDERTDVVPIQHPNGEFIRTEFPLLASGVKRQEKGLPLREADYSKDIKKAIHIFGPPPVQLHHAEVFEALTPVFRGDALKIGHNFKFDVKSVAKYLRGIIPAPKYFCTMIASWLLDSRRGDAKAGYLMTNDVPGLDLATCLQRELGVTMVKGIGAKVENHSFMDVAKYAALDSYWTYRLAAALIEQLREVKLSKMMRLEMDNLGATADMELEGAPINVKALDDLHEILEREVEAATGKVYKAAGRAFNLNSTPEKQEILFGSKKDGGRGLRAYKKTKTGAPSTDAEALEKHRGKDVLVDAMLEHADVNKLMSTYVIPYRGGTVTHTSGGKSKEVEKKSLLRKGRIHTEFKQHGAETGRYSSVNPNLQNVPNASTETGMAIRKLFCAPEGYTLVCADYSQIEPRIIADLSKDPILLGAYQSGTDVYMAMVEGEVLKPFGLPRSGGKVAVLAMSYGVGPDKVESSLHIPAGQGSKLLDGFEKQFKAVYAYKRRVVAEARNRRPEPYVSTLFGRRRYLPDLNSRDKWRRARAERQAFNTRIQGTAADIMKVAIARAHVMLPPEAKLILTIHDELLTLCPEEMAPEVAEVIREAMEGIHVLKDVNLVAEVKTAKTWGEAK